MKLQREAKFSCFVCAPQHIKVSEIKKIPTPKSGEYVDVFYRGFTSKLYNSVL